MIRCWRRFVDVVETCMDSAVLDTSIVAKSVLEPLEAFLLRCINEKLRHVGKSALS